MSPFFSCCRTVEFFAFPCAGVVCEIARGSCRSRVTKMAVRRKVHWTNHGWRRDTGESNVTLLIHSLDNTGRQHPVASGRLASTIPMADSELKQRAEDYFRRAYEHQERGQ